MAIKRIWLFTDPPYGINAEKMTMGTGKRDFHRGEGWDNERPDISMCFELAPLVCIWGGNYFADKLPVTNDWLIWHKRMTDFHSVSANWLGLNFEHKLQTHITHWGNEKNNI